MKRLLVGVVGGVAALSVIFGAGPASADNEYKGQTYEQVMKSTGNRAVIASRSGSYLPTEQCRVTGNRRATYGNGETKLLVDLNCNDASALNGHPGNSVVTDAGKRALKWRGYARDFSANYAASIEAGKTPRCLANEDEMKGCLRLCKETGECSAELEEALGM